jgi:hypothetical protein
VFSLDGEMVELSGTVSKDNKQAFWNQMVWYMRVQGWSKGRASNTYKDKFGVWPRGLRDDTPSLPSDDTRKFIDKKLKQFLRSVGRR